MANTSGINMEVKVNGEKLGTVTSFKYLGSVVSDTLQDSTDTAALTIMLKPVWTDISFFLSSGHD